MVHGHAVFSSGRAIGGTCLISVVTLGSLPGGWGNPQESQ